MNNCRVVHPSSFRLHHSNHDHIHDRLRPCCRRDFVAVTAKSVNHRFLETSVRIPEYLWEAEAMVRAIASDTFARGKVDISIRVQRTTQPDYNVRINTQIANTVVPQLRAIAEELGLGSTFSGSDLLRVPDLLQVEAIDAEITEE